MPLTFPLVGSGEDADKALVATRVLIVDDHPLTREALGSLLQQHGFEIAGQAEDGEQAVALARELAPDLLDLTMPVDSFAALPRIREPRRHARSSC